jgi:hypothetical protein
MTIILDHTGVGENILPISVGFIKGGDWQRNGGWYNQQMMATFIHLTPLHPSDTLTTENSRRRKHLRKGVSAEETAPKS